MVKLDNNKVTERVVEALLNIVENQAAPSYERVSAARELRKSGAVNIYDYRNSKE